MQKVVEIFVRTEKLAVDKGTRYELTEQGGHYCTRKVVRDVVFEDVLPQAQQATIEMLRALCNEAEAEMRVYDICTFKGKLRANLKQVKKIPTIISGDNRIEGTAERKQILSLLK